MIKIDIVNRLVDRLDMPRLMTAQAVNTVFEILKEALAGGDRIELRRFWIFRVANRKTGAGRTPKTGQVIHITYSC